MRSAAARTLRPPHDLDLNELLGWIALLAVVAAVLGVLALGIKSASPDASAASGPIPVEQLPEVTQAP